MSDTASSSAAAPRPPFKHFCTPRLLLREARADDATALHEFLSDPETMAYWSSLPHTSLHETELWVAKMLQSPANGVTDFMIISVDTQLPIGKIGIWSGNEIGFLIARSHWRKGLAAEALQELLPWYFNDTREGKRIESIKADIDPRNAASRGLLEKFGFVETGREEKTYNIGGVWVDSVYLELTREEWKTTAKPELGLVGRL